MNFKLLLFLFTFFVGRTFLKAQQIYFNKSLYTFCLNTTADFKKISSKRKVLLNNIAIEMASRKYIVFACATNTRRTQLLQTWMQTAFYYYNLTDKRAFSYGDSVSDIYPEVVNVLKHSGFSCSLSNTLPKGYIISTSDSTHDYVITPKNSLGKLDIATTAHINICDGRETYTGAPSSYIRLPYESPKKFEKKPSEPKKYNELNKKIATEMLYLAAQIHILVSKSK